ncbi:hypothetical protein AMTR_s00045p00109790 [Amborella trichopoda]|uniref:ABC transmembrane type-1 domain-containing protein n=1 Tax=Amborella trichopoda TaxID=13333 RepID=W1P4Y4_AMBTC|nr:hypothetical protein AMTR_s00045p00109790 [Amborella trichopoda]
MAEQNGSELVAPPSSAPVTEAVTDSGVAIKHVGDPEKREEERGVIYKSVPYYKLFSFADSKDAVLMVVGSIAAIGSGLSMPVMTILFGKMVNSFGQTQDITKVVHVVSKVSTLTFNVKTQIILLGNNKLISFLYGQIARSSLVGYREQ